MTQVGMRLCFQLVAILLNNFHQKVQQQCVSTSSVRHQQAITARSIPVQTESWSHLEWALSYLRAVRLRKPTLDVKKSLPVKMLHNVDIDCLRRHTAVVPWHCCIYTCTLLLLQEEPYAEKTEPIHNVKKTLPVQVCFLLCIIIACLCLDTTCANKLLLLHRHTAVAAGERVATGGMAQHSTARHSTAQHSTAQHSTAHCTTTRPAK